MYEVVSDDKQSYGVPDVFVLMIVIFKINFLNIYFILSIYRWRWGKAGSMLAKLSVLFDVCWGN